MEIVYKKYVVTAPSNFAGGVLIKKYVKGRCYAIRFSEDLTQHEVLDKLKKGEVKLTGFQPFSEVTGEFI